MFYLDYGNYRYGVARGELRVLLEQLCALPALAIHCALPITAITWVRARRHSRTACPLPDLFLYSQSPARLFLEPFIDESLFLIALQSQGSSLSPPPSNACHTRF